MKKLTILISLLAVEFVCIGQSTIININTPQTGIDIDLNEILQAVNDSASPLFITNTDLIDSLESSNWDQTTYGYYTGNMSYFPVDSGVIYVDSLFTVINNGTTMVKALLSGGGGGNGNTVVDTLFFGSTTSGEYITSVGNVVRHYANDGSEVFEVNDTWSGITSSSGSAPLIRTVTTASSTNCNLRIHKNYNTGPAGSGVGGYANLIVSGVEGIRTTGTEVSLAAPNSASSPIKNGSISFDLDESGGNVIIRIQESDGSTHTVTLAYD